ncbi:MAG: site-specific integrase [Alphaproteobacteria bacterium]|nr:site-specific integrase [Alphaproteobacteria bacterium]
MATFRKLPSGKWQAQVARKGVRRSASFDTKRSAQDWAARQEYLALNQSADTDKSTLADLFDRYARDESPKRRGARWEVIRLSRLARDPLGQVRVSEVGPSDLAAWRDRRMAEVSAGSVRRELALLSAVFNVACREWRVLDQNPVSEIRKPPPTPPRDRRVSDDEIELLVAAGGGDLQSKTGRAVHAFLFAIETAMRAGEIARLTDADVDRTARVAHLALTKNGSARDVPLSRRAIDLIDALPAQKAGRALFGLSSAQIDVLFRKARDKAAIADLTFHDSRHEAITRLSRKLDVLSLARSVGHKDVRMLMVYYNESAQDLAQRLD